MLLYVSPAPPFHSLLPPLPPLLPPPPPPPTLIECVPTLYHLSSASTSPPAPPPPPWYILCPQPPPPPTSIMYSMVRAFGRSKVPDEVKTCRTQPSASVVVVQPVQVAVTRHGGDGGGGRGGGSDGGGGADGGVLGDGMSGETMSRTNCIWRSDWAKRASRLATRAASSLKDTPLTSTSVEALTLSVPSASAAIRARL